MYTSTDIQEIIYVSTLAADAPIRAVADIAAKSRTTNRRLDITGLLVFDGMHFCQQLEGGAQELAGLMARIREDPRHTQVAVLHHGPLDKRRFWSFSLGYTSAEDVEALERMRQLQGQAAVDAFVALLSSLDVDG
ncbi:MAG: BLUF domain-containing protein [Polaromonas sp.]